MAHEAVAAAQPPVAAGSPSVAPESDDEPCTPGTHACRLNARHGVADWTIEQLYLMGHCPWPLHLGQSCGSWDVLHTAGHALDTTDPLQHVVKPDKQPLAGEADDDDELEQIKRSPEVRALLDEAATLGMDIQADMIFGGALLALA
jgi:hypothetical protein